MTSASLSGSRIRHSVAFALRHDEGSPEEASFLAALRSLQEIDVFETFEVVREVSPKNSFRLGASMEFADQAAYDVYNADPRHLAFVQDRWVPEVTDFLEIDFAPLGR